MLFKDFVCRVIKPKHSSHFLEKTFEMLVPLEVSKTRKEEQENPFVSVLSQVFSWLFIRYWIRNKAITLCFFIITFSFHICSNVQIFSKINMTCLYFILEFVLSLFNSNCNQYTFDMFGSLPNTRTGTRKYRANSYFVDDTNVSCIIVVI